MDRPCVRCHLAIWRLQQSMLSRIHESVRSFNSTYDMDLDRQHGELAHRGSLKVDQISIGFAAARCCPNMLANIRLRVRVGAHWNMDWVTISRL